MSEVASAATEEAARFFEVVACESANVRSDMDPPRKKYRIATKKPEHLRNYTGDPDEYHRSRCHSETEQARLGRVILCSSCHEILTEDAYVPALLAGWRNGGCVDMAVCGRCIVTSSPEYMSVLRVCQECRAGKTLREFGAILCAIVLTGGEEHLWQWRCRDCQRLHCRGSRRRKGFKTPPSPSES